MKRAILLILSAAVVFGGWAAASEKPGDDWNRRTYFEAYVPYKVTISRNGEVMTVVTVPKGAFLSVYSRENEQPTRMGLQSEFHGDLMVRILPEAEVERTESRRSRDIMAKAPLVMTLADVDIVVKPVNPGSRPLPN